VKGGAIVGGPTRVCKFCTALIRNDIPLHIRAYIFIIVFMGFFAGRCLFSHHLAPRELIFSYFSLKYPFYFSIKYEKLRFVKLGENDQKRYDGDRERNDDDVKMKMENDLFIKHTETSNRR
jgi:hypothetical protein